MLSIWTSTKFYRLVNGKPFSGFTCLQYKSFENIVGKGETARNKQFLLFPPVFYPFILEESKFCCLGNS